MKILPTLLLAYLFATPAMAQVKMGSSPVGPFQCSGAPQTNQKFCAQSNTGIELVDAVSGGNVFRGFTMDMHAVGINATTASPNDLANLGQSPWTQYAMGHQWISAPPQGQYFSTACNYTNPALSNCIIGKVLGVTPLHINGDGTCQPGTDPSGATCLGANPTYADFAFVQAYNGTTKPNDDTKISAVQNATQDYPSATVLGNAISIGTSVMYSSWAYLTTGSTIYTIQNVGSVVANNVSIFAYAGPNEIPYPPAPNSVEYWFFGPNGYSSNRYGVQESYGLIWIEPNVIGDNIIWSNGTTMVRQMFAKFGFPPVGGDSGSAILAGSQGCRGWVGDVVSTYFADRTIADIDDAATDMRQAAKITGLTMAVADGKPCTPVVTGSAKIARMVAAARQVKWDDLHNISNAVRVDSGDMVGMVGLYKDGLHVGVMRHFQPITPDAVLTSRIKREFYVTKGMSRAVPIIVEPYKLVSVNSQHTGH